MTPPPPHSMASGSMVSGSVPNGSVATGRPSFPPLDALAERGIDVTEAYDLALPLRLVSGLYHVRSGCAGAGIYVGGHVNASLYQVLGHLCSACGPEALEAVSPLCDWLYGAQALSGMGALTQIAHGRRGRKSLLDSGSNETAVTDNQFLVGVVDQIRLVRTRRRKIAGNSFPCLEAQIEAALDLLDTFAIDVVGTLDVDELNWVLSHQRAAASVDVVADDEIMPEHPTLEHPTLAGLPAEVLGASVGSEATAAPVLLPAAQKHALSALWVDTYRRAIAARALSSDAAEQARRAVRASGVCAALVAQWGAVVCVEVDEFCARQARRVQDEVMRGKSRRQLVAFAQHPSADGGEEVLLLWALIVSQLGTARKERGGVVVDGWAAVSLADIPGVLGPYPIRAELDGAALRQLPEVFTSLWAGALEDPAAALDSAVASLA